MITTGDNQIKSNSKLYITNVINNSNIERAQVAYSNVTIYIDSKFELPTKKYTDLSTGNEQIDNYVEQLITLNNLPNGIAETIRQKVKYWFCEWILKQNSCSERVFIDTQLSKHEWIAVGILNNLGITGFIVSDTQIQYKLPGINYGEITCNIEELEDSGIKLNYKATCNEVATYTKKEKHEVKDIKDIIDEFCSNVYNSATIVNGWTDNKDDSLALSELIKSEETGYVTIKNKFEQPLVSDTNIMNVYGDYSNISNNISGILNRIVGANIRNFDIQSISKAIIKEFKELEPKYNISQLKNKLIVTIGIIAKLMRSQVVTHIVFLGVPGSNDSIIIEVLKECKQFNLLVINSDLSKHVEINGIKSISFEKSVESIKFLSLIESNNIAKTLAASVETSVNNTVYGNDTIGLYRPGQLDYASCIRLQTTFDETNNWLVEDAFIRPGYGTDGNRVILPTMFKIIMGIKDSMDGVSNNPQLNSSNVEQYIRYISRQFNDNSILFRSFKELEQSLYNQSFSESNYTFKIEKAFNTKDYIESKTKLFSDGALNRKAIMSSRFYNYSLLSENKQYMILDVIERILTEGYIDYKKYNITYEKYVDTVMQLLLTIHPSIINKIHASNFHGKVPRIILVSATDDGNTLRYLLQSAIMLCALSLMGFDILIYVPNAYNNLNSIYTDKFNIDVHIIGDPVIDNIKLSSIPAAIKSMPMLNSNCGAVSGQVTTTSNNYGASSGEPMFNNGDFESTFGNKPKKQSFFKRLFK